MSEIDENSFFTGASKVSARGGSDKFLEGVYPAVRIDTIKVNSGFHGLRYIVETTVLEDGRPGRGGTGPAPTGAKGSWGVQIDGKNKDLSLGEIKAFLGVLLGKSPEEMNALPEGESERLMLESRGPGQPYTGAILATECWVHTTGSGFKMNKHTWDLVKAAGPATPVPDLPVPPAPEVPSLAGPPPGFFAFPATDPRNKTHYYNAEGETVPIT